MWCDRILIDMGTLNCASSYLHSALDPEKVKTTVKETIRMIKQSKIEFDSIAFRGMSGALIAPMVAMALGKPVSMVRKREHNSHCGLMVEGCDDPATYIIVDDMISSGETMKLIVKAMGDRHTRPECVGIFLYIPKEHFYNSRRNTKCDNFEIYRDGRIAQSIPCFKNRYLEHKS